MATTVSYAPNDPLASGGPPIRSVTAGNYPPGDIAKFDVPPAAKPGKYPRRRRSSVLADQARADRRTPDVEEDDRGVPSALVRGPARPAGLTDAGDDLNAFYDRASLQFFSHGFGGVTVHSAATVDVVVHEQGHALLDAIRPDFFDVPFIEVGALHEAFGDCKAILNAFEDESMRDAVIKASPDLSADHFVESLAEGLGDAIAREYGAESVEAGACATR